MKTLGERIRFIRGEESQAEFAERVGIAKGSIGGYENGRNSPSDEGDFPSIFDENHTTSSSRLQNVQKNSPGFVSVLTRAGAALFSFVVRKRS